MDGPKSSLSHALYHYRFPFFSRDGREAEWHSLDDVVVCLLKLYDQTIHEMSSPITPVSESKWKLSPAARGVNLPVHYGLDPELRLQLGALDA